MDKWVYFVGCLLAFVFGCFTTHNYYEAKVARINEAHAEERARSLAAEKKIRVEEALKRNERMAETQREISKLNADLDRVRANADKLRASSKRSDRDRAGYCDLGVECGRLLVQALEAVRHCQR